MTQIMLRKLISPRHKCSIRHAGGLVQTGFSATTICHRLNLRKDGTGCNGMLPLSSIKRDVKKKVLPRPDAEKIFVSRSSPLPVSVPLDSLERLRRGLLPFPWLSSSSGDDANRVLDLA